MSDITISQLNIYPVKSCKGISKQQSLVEPFGLQNDRRWMLVDQHGVFITQRQLPRMCLIAVGELDNGIVFVLPDETSCVVSIPSQNDFSDVVVWGDQVSALDAGNKAAKFLGDFLQTNCRLVYFPDNEVRQVDLDYAQTGDKTAFSDGFPLLLISEASLEDLNSRLENPVSMERFRPNIVVKGCEPFAEDSWKKIRVGDVTMRVVKPCSRCAIPTINTETAEKSSEPLKTLASYRRQGNKVFFGQNVIAENEEMIAVGNRVDVES